MESRKRLRINDNQRATLESCYERAMIGTGAKCKSRDWFDNDASAGKKLKFDLLVSLLVIDHDLCLT